ncbi:MAG TPA: hypothetical protein VGF01_12265, partial [Terracidiphilus sp.]
MCPIRHSPAPIVLDCAPSKGTSFTRFHAGQPLFFFLAWALVAILAKAVQNLVPSTEFRTETVLQLVDRSLS